jgi:hypothetical protein
MADVVTKEKLAYLAQTAPEPDRLNQEGYAYANRFEGPIVAGKVDLSHFFTKGSTSSNGLIVDKTPLGVVELHFKPNGLPDYADLKGRINEHVVLDDKGFVTHDTVDLGNHVIASAGYDRDHHLISLTVDSVETGKNASHTIGRVHRAYTWDRQAQLTSFHGDDASRTTDLQNDPKGGTVLVVKDKIGQDAGGTVKYHFAPRGGRLDHLTYTSPDGQRASATIEPDGSIVFLPPSTGV